MTIIIKGHNLQTALCDILLSTIQYAGQAPDKGTVGEIEPPYWMGDETLLFIVY